MGQKLCCGQKQKGHKPLQNLESSESRKSTDTRPIKATRRRMTKHLEEEIENKPRIQHLPDELNTKIDYKKQLKIMKKMSTVHEEIEKSDSAVSNLRYDLTGLNVQNQGFSSGLNIKQEKPILEMLEDRDSSDSDFSFIPMSGCLIKLTSEDFQCFEPLTIDRMTCHVLIPKDSNQKFGGSQNARLTRYIRQMVYGFLTLKETIVKISALNKFERNFLTDSAFARQNKAFSMELRYSKLTQRARWVTVNERSEVRALCEIPPCLVDYITRLVSQLNITVNLYQQNQLQELSALLVNLPRWYDKQCLSLSLIDRPNQDDGQSMSFNQFAKELQLSKKTMVFDRLEYMGFEGQNNQTTPEGFATLFTSTQTLVLRDAHIDLQKVSLEQKSSLKHLHLEYSLFMAPKQDLSHQISLESFIGRKSEWAPVFGEMTNLKYVQSIEVTDPVQQNFFADFLPTHGSQLTSLRSLVYTNRKDAHLHSMHPLLPRDTMLDLVSLTTQDTAYQRDEISAATNAYDVVLLTKLLDLQYTRASKASMIRVNELVLDAKIPGYDKELQGLTQVKERQGIEGVVQLDGYVYCGTKQKGKQYTVTFQEAETMGSVHITAKLVSTPEPLQLFGMIK